MRLNETLRRYATRDFIHVSTRRFICVSSNGYVLVARDYPVRGPRFLEFLRAHASLPGLGLVILIAGQPALFPISSRNYVLACSRFSASSLDAIFAPLRGTVSAPTKDYICVSTEGLFATARDFVPPRGAKYICTSATNCKACCESASKNI